MIMRPYLLILVTSSFFLFLSCQADDPPYFVNAHPKVRIITEPIAFDATVQGPDTTVLFSSPRSLPYNSEVAQVELIAWDDDSGVRQMVIEVEGNIDVKVENLNRAFSEQIFSDAFFSKHIMERKSNVNQFGERGLADLLVEWRGLPKRGVVSEWHWIGKITIRVTDWGLPVGPEKQTVLQLVYDWRQGDVS